MGLRLHLLGKKFNRLTVIKDAGLDSSKKVIWECLCDCGKIIVCNSYKLTHNSTKSCGCYKKDWHTKNKVKHGQSSENFKTSEYIAWKNMKSRCYNSKNSRYADWGGRGIKVCDRWLNSFENFFYDMGKKPSTKHSLDRIDVNGNYEPDNCRWATNKEQASNKNINRHLTADNKTMNMSDWAIELKCNPSQLLYFLYRGYQFQKVADYLRSDKYEQQKQKRKLSGRAYGKKKDKSVEHFAKKILSNQPQLF